jgi:hypothetical protein
MHVANFYFANHRFGNLRPERQQCGGYADECRQGSIFNFNTVKIYDTTERTCSKQPEGNNYDCFLHRNPVCAAYGEHFQNYGTGNQKYRA